MNTSYNRKDYIRPSLTMKWVKPMSNELDDANGGLNLLTVSPDHEGETVKVVSTGRSIGNMTVIDAYVDEDGIIRQQTNDACLNADSYQVKQ